MPRIVTTLIDDTDSRFTYEGTWTKHKNPHEYGQSSHLTHGTGTATLKFRGTSISVYGTLASSAESQTDPTPPMSLYTLENGRSATFTAARATAESRYRAQFFTINNLPFGDHVLVVKNTAEKDMFLLDYVEIGGPARSYMPVAALVGVIVGSVIGTLLLVLGVVLYRRRRGYTRKSAYSIKHEGAPGGAHNHANGSITPFNLDSLAPEVSVWTRLGHANPLSTTLNSKSGARVRDIESGAGAGDGESGARAGDAESRAGAVDGERSPVDACASRSIVISVCCDSCVAAGERSGNNPPPYHCASSELRTESHVV